MRGKKNLQQQIRHLREKVKAWYDKFLLDTGDGGGNADSTGTAAPIRKVELPKLAVEANNFVTLGATGGNTAGFRQLATELKTMGAPISDTGAA